MEAYDVVMDLMRRGYIAKTEDRLSIMVMVSTINKAIDAKVELERERACQIVSMNTPSGSPSIVLKIVNGN